MERRQEANGWVDFCPQLQFGARGKPFGVRVFTDPSSGEDFIFICVSDMPQDGHHRYVYVINGTAAAIFGLVQLGIVFRKVGEKKTHTFSHRRLGSGLTAVFTFFLPIFNFGAGIIFVRT